MKARFDTIDAAPSGPTPGHHVDDPDRERVEREERGGVVVGAVAVGRDAEEPQGVLPFGRRERRRPVPGRDLRRPPGDARRLLRWQRQQAHAERGDREQQDADDQEDDEGVAHALAQPWCAHAGAASAAGV